MKTYENLCKANKNYETHRTCVDLADLAEPETVNVSFSLVFVCFSEAGTGRGGTGEVAARTNQGGTKDAPRRQCDFGWPSLGVIDFASRFPPRQLEPRALELDLGTLKIESGACDLPPEGSEKNIWRSLQKKS